MSELHLNRVDQLTAASAERHPDPTPPDMIVMVDIESLALGPRPVITQIAMLGYDLQEDELLDLTHVHYYPIEPQQRIIPPRVIHADTLAWWMRQSDDARERFELSTATEFEDLAVLARNLIATFKRLTQNGKANYELVARGPQFDIVAIESLLLELGLEVPWDYRKVRDLRTMLAVAGLNEKNIAKPAGMIPHVAYWDARYGIVQYLEAKKALAGRV